MAKTFNVTAVCLPEEHYMVDIHRRLEEIKVLIDSGKYFTINRARQYGKTTTLIALEQYLQTDYYVVFLDFQTFDEAKFQNGNVFSLSFASSFLRALKKTAPEPQGEFKAVLDHMKKSLENRRSDFTLMELFELLGDLCASADKPIVLMIDEVDSAADNRVFLDFLAQLRACYIRRAVQPAFQSVILAGVYDIKNLRQKVRPDKDHKYNSPWNIAADFNIDMSFSKEDISGMLCEYEADHQTGMDTDKMAGLLYEYTSGYPFLVSRLCQLIDKEVSRNASAWSVAGFHEAVRTLLSEKNTLFESLIAKLADYPELDTMLRNLLFTGKNIAYNADEPAIDMATMFGFIKNQGGNVVIANRIFETRLYNLYLSTSEMQNQDIYKASLQDKNQFITDGHLNMRMVLERFVTHFHDLYGHHMKTFVEEEGRKYFLLYLRPIINGVGNYYIESRTRDFKRTDVIVDYRGEQFIIEMKLWHGSEYHLRGEKQLVGYLDDYHQDTGYMLSFNFNKKKQIGIREMVVQGKTIIEATV